MKTRNANLIIADINRCASLIEGAKGVKDENVSYKRTSALYTLLYDLSTELNNLMAPWSNNNARY